MPALGPISGGSNLTANQTAAITGANSPSAGNVFATITDIPASDTPDQRAAIDGANNPSALNVFATMADIPADELTADELAAVQGANAPTALNVFATMADISGGGAVLQIVGGAKTDTATVTGQAFSSVFTSTITTSDANNKVAIIAMLTVGANTSQFVNIRLVRSATDLLLGDASSSRTRVTTQSNPAAAGQMQCANVVFLDSPGSAGTHTYEIHIASNTTGAVYLNRPHTDTDAATSSRGASFMLLAEVVPS